jgi:SnoaL-like domain
LTAPRRENFESSRIEPHEFIEAGEHVVVPWTFHAVGRDGLEVQARLTWLFTIRDGAIQRACMYQERSEALEAAGLSESQENLEIVRRAFPAWPLLGERMEKHSVGGPQSRLSRRRLCARRGVG